MKDSMQLLTSGHLLARNTIWSLVGNSVPLGIAVIAIPVVIKHLGTERFGLLSIIWVVIGYFSVFDLGLSRALTQLIAKQLGKGDEQEIPDLVTTALVLIVVLGVVAAVLVTVITPWLVINILKTSSTLQLDGVDSLRILALTLPCIILSGALIGLLQAYQQFRITSAVHMVTGSLTFLCPLLTSYWTPELTAAASALAVSRIIATAAYAWQCWCIFPSLWREARFHRTLVQPLIRFGSWFTISNIIGPLMVSLDRFLIGAVIGLTAVAYYTTPYEVITRIWVLPLAFVNVFFPAFTTALAADEARVQVLFMYACHIMLLILIPLVALIVLFAPEGLSFWVGQAFAQHSTVVLRWLAIGVLINSLARFPHALVQGAGRPDLIAKLHIFELPLYLGVLWLLLHTLGIAGAAIAWVVRITFDTFAIFWIGARLVPAVRITTWRVLELLATGSAGIGLLVLISGMYPKLAVGGGLVLAAAALSWREIRLVGFKRFRSAVTVK